MQNITYSVFSLAETDPHSEGIAFGAKGISLHLSHASNPLKMRFHRRQLEPNGKTYRNEDRAD